MRERVHRSFVVSVCAFVSAAAMALSLWSPQGEQVRTADQNGDGRPDIWRTYNRHGQLLRIALDTNFDGRSDVEEFYQRGALVRRQLDRDFNDRIDLVEDFDPTSHDQVRAEVDVDSDGTTDLLVLYQTGQPVVWKYRDPVPPPVATVFAGLEEKTSHRSANDRLSGLRDSFGGDLAVRATHLVRFDDGATIGLAPAGAFPGSRFDVICAWASSTMPAAGVSCPVFAPPALHSPRGPPAAPPLT